MDVRAALVAQRIDEATVDAFLNWHAANPKVWELFETKTLALIEAGKTHWGAKSVAEMIRFERSMLEGGQFEDYALNNNYPAYYARVFALKYPSHADFFEFRTIKGLTNVGVKNAA